MIESITSSFRSRKSLFIFAGILLLALGVRVLFPLGNDMSFDEIYSLRLAQHSFHDVWSMSRYETNPAFFYILLSGWIKIVGTSPIALRVLSLIGGLMTVLGGWALAKELGGKKAGIISALFFALSPFVIYFSREARMYPLMTAAGLWAFYFFWKYLRDRKTLALFLYLFFLTIAGVLHLSALVLVAVHWAVIFFSRSLRPMSRLRWTLIHLPTVALCSFFVLRTLIARAPFGGSLTDHWLFHMPQRMYYFISMLQTGLFSSAGFFGGLDIFVMLIILLSVVWFFCRSSLQRGQLFLFFDKERHEARWWLAAVTFIPIILAYIVGIYHEKFFVLSLAFWLILFAVGISRIQHQLFRLAIVIFVCVLSFVSLPTLIQGSRGINWPNVVSYIYANAKPEDVVIIHLFHETMSFEYYDAQRTLPIKGFFPGKETQTFEDITIYNPYPVVTKDNVSYLEHLTSGHERVWLIDTMGYNMDFWNGSIVRDWFTSHGWNMIQKKSFGMYQTGVVLEYERSN